MDWPHVARANGGKLPASLMARQTVSDCAYKQLKSALKASSASRIAVSGGWGFARQSAGGPVAVASMVLVADQFQGNSSARRERGQHLAIRSMTSAQAAASGGTAR